MPTVRRRSAAALPLLAALLLGAAASARAAGVPAWYQCNADNCKAPDCHCASLDIPGGLSAEETPMVSLSGPSGGGACLRAGAPGHARWLRFCINAPAHKSSERSTAASGHLALPGIVLQLSRLADRWEPAIS